MRKTRNEKDEVKNGNEVKNEYRKQMKEVGKMRMKEKKINQKNEEKKCK